MSRQIKFIGTSSVSNTDALLAALFLASVFHMLIVLGVNFTAPKPEKINRSIDITLANSPVKKAPKKAKMLAQDNQIGAGNKQVKPEPPKKKIPQQGKGKKKLTKKAKTPKKTHAPRKIVSTTAVAKRKSQSAKKDSKKTATQKKPQLSAEALQKQIAELGAEIRRRQQSSDVHKIKFVNSVSTHKYVAAQYMNDWQRKVERTGNMNYPEVAKKRNFFGKLTMDVGIKADGSIYSIRISRSSGNKALDDAAKRIVRMSAPFPPLPKALLKELDVLVITRVWKFTDESMRSR